MTNQYTPFRVNRFQQGGELNLKHNYVGSEENPIQLHGVQVTYPSKNKIKELQKYYNAPQTGIWGGNSRRAYYQYLYNTSKKLANRFNESPVSVSELKQSYSDYPGINFVSNLDPNITEKYVGYIPGKANTLPEYEHNPKRYYPELQSY